MIAWLAGSRLGRLFGVVAAALLAVVGARAVGRREGRQQAAIDTLRHTVTALQTRERIDDAIDQDPDLAARARSTGLMRDEPR
jgi:hypothetical protein